MKATANKLEAALNSLLSDIVKLRAKVSDRQRFAYEKSGKWKKSIRGMAYVDKTFRIEELLSDMDDLKDLIERGVLEADGIAEKLLKIYGKRSKV